MKKMYMFILFILFTMQLYACNVPSEDENETDASKDSSVDVLFPEYDNCGYEFRDSITKELQKEGSDSLIFCPLENNLDKDCCVLTGINADSMKTPMQKCGVSINRPEETSEGMLKCGIICTNDNQCSEGNICANYY